MKKINSFSIALAIMVQCSFAYSMEDNKQHFVIIPGQNGLGGQNINTVFPQFALAALKKNPTFVSHTSTTPSTWIDFGQNNCQAHLKMTLENEDLIGKTFIAHCSSQGTATGINFTAQYSYHVKALILESVMLSGNSAISHTVEHVYSNLITQIPGSYYWLPYLAKCTGFFPYSPAGEQPIFNVDSLPKDLPIIILHHKKDPQLSFKDAQALYAHLKNSGNDNVYFIAKDSNALKHVLLLNKNNTKEISAINRILEKHDALKKDEDILADHEFNADPNRTPHIFLKYTANDKIEFDTKEYTQVQKAYNTISLMDIDLKEYQPEIKAEWINHFNNVLRKEKRFTPINWMIRLSIVSLITYLLYQQYNKE